MLKRATGFEIKIDDINQTLVVIVALAGDPLDRIKSNRFTFDWTGWDGIRLSGGKKERNPIY